MHAVLRVLPLALGQTVAVLALRAQPGPVGLPPIFSGEPPRVQRSSPLPVPEIVRPRSAMSERMRAQLHERVAARVDALPVANATPMRAWTFDQGDALVMTPYVVNVPPGKRVEFQRRQNPLYYMFSSGELHQFEGWLGSPSLRWGLGNVRMPLVGTASTAPRVELSLNWRF